MVVGIYSASVRGLDAELIRVEVSVDKGIPAYNVVGLAGTAIRESGNRIKPAFANSEINYPKKKITVNLVPAGNRKDGSHFDLPIALGVLAVENNYPQKTLDEYGVMGELSLEGKVNRITGALPMAIKMIEEGKTKIIIPEENIEEVSIIKKGKLYPVKSLEDMIELFENPSKYNDRWSEKSIQKCIVERNNSFNSSDINCDLDYSDIFGQEKAKRALEICAAGNHGLLMIGSPGVGKTMLCKRIKSILPPMTEDEILETTKIYSVSGLLNKKMPFVNKRPIRQPHHTITLPALLGGGQKVIPGEMTLAHNGVLFLDELSQFDSKVLDGMREPLEEKMVTIARLGGTVSLPANILLIAASNPCKCGYLGDTKRLCTCTQSQINGYRGKFSGPLLDRIDIHVELGRIEKDEMLGDDIYNSEYMKGRVIAARKIQEIRYSQEKIMCNGDMDNRHLKKYLNITKKGILLLDSAYANMCLSIRTYNKIKRISRTIADIDNCEEVREEHIAEAIQYREKILKE